VKQVPKLNCGDSRIRLFFERWIMEPRPRFELGTLAFSDLGYQGNALGCIASTRLSHRGCDVRSECLLIKFRSSETVHFHYIVMIFCDHEMTET
jgi:hypothetical protein